MLKFTWYPFTALSAEQIYNVLALRAQVFVVEQQCLFLDPDHKDRVAIHLFGEEDNHLVIYMRLFPPTETQNWLTFGRVVAAKSVRGKGYGKKLIQEMLAYGDQHYPGVTIKCSAQYYLKKFYEGFGLKAYGEVYDEDAMPHIAMKKES